MINVFQPSLGEEEANVVREVFLSNWIGKGKRVTEFEKRYAEFLNVDSSNLITTIAVVKGYLHQCTCLI